MTADREILPSTPAPRPIQGRDELNLADFPISVLQYQQPKDGTGRKLDTVVYQASRYDTQTRQRVPQQVTLTTSSRYGLPTATDEDVVLSLLCLGKRRNNFTDAKVHFTPHELFQIMHWSANAKDYQRLRNALRRLKALTIVYENAWWDGKGRRYEEEFASGILSEYRLVRPSEARAQKGQLPPSWAQWTPRFHQSLLGGNLKALDLEKLFTLRLPTSRRMYRFLDKRFHNAETVEIDLVDFACGHIGLAPVSNVAILKQRLLPAIRELEGIGFIEPADVLGRYRKVARGVWRIGFTRKKRVTDKQKPSLDKPANFPPNPAQQLVAGFYRLWQGSEAHEPTRREIGHAEKLIEEHGLEKIEAALPMVVATLRKKWPEAKTFSAFVSYLPEAIEKFEQKQQAENRQKQEREHQAAEKKQRAEEIAQRQQFESHWLPRWNALSPSEQENIRRQLLAENPWLAGMPTLFERRCLETLARQSTEIVTNKPNA